MMEIIHPASHLATQFNDAKKREKATGDDLKEKGKEVRVKEKTTGTVQASSVQPSSDRLNLSKAGEAQRLYEDKQIQIQADHELALLLEEEKKLNYKKKRKRKNHISRMTTPLIPSLRPRRKC